MLRINQISYIFELLSVWYSDSELKVLHPYGFIGGRGEKLPYAFNVQ